MAHADDLPYPVGNVEKRGRICGLPTWQTGKDKPDIDAQEQDLPHPIGNKKQSRICGLKRRTVVLVCALAALVLVIAAVVGGVLGSRSAKSHNHEAVPLLSSNSLVPVQASRGSGLAVVAAADNSDQLYMYWQDPDGSIIEGQYVNADFLQSTRSTVVAAGLARRNTPISAIAWRSGAGTANRAIFYVGERGDLMTTNTTSTVWSESVDMFDIFGDTVAAGAQGLAACVDTSTGLNGIRVFYGSGKDGGVKECKTDFERARNGDTLAGYWLWEVGWGKSTDPTGGIGCTLRDGALTMYCRNTSTYSISGQLRGTTLETSEIPTWSLGKVQARLFESGKPGADSHTGFSGGNIGEYTDFAVSSGARADNIFLQQANGSIRWDQQVNNVSTEGRSLGVASSGSKIATVNTADGPLVLYQSEANDTQITYELLDANNQSTIKTGYIMT